MGEANDEKHGLERKAKWKLIRNRSELRARICGADTHIYYSSSRRGPRIHPIYLDKMVCFAQLAIGLYNINKLTDFAQVKVLKVVVTYTGAVGDYRIYFHAFPCFCVNASLFKAKVRQCITENPSIKIMSVRIKHKDQQTIYEQQPLSQHLSAVYLAPYLSQLALVMYNIFTLRQGTVAVHDIPSLKVVKAMKHVEAEGMTYSVTFEASLGDESKNIETFQAQICVSTLSLPTTIEFKQVQIKHD